MAIVRSEVDRLTPMVRDSRYELELINDQVTSFEQTARAVQGTLDTMFQLGIDTNQILNTSNEHAANLTQSLIEAQTQIRLQSTGDIGWLSLLILFSCFWTYGFTRPFIRLISAFIVIRPFFLFIFPIFPPIFPLVYLQHSTLAWPKNFAAFSPVCRQAMTALLAYACIVCSRKRAKSLSTNSSSIIASEKQLPLRNRPNVYISLLSQFAYQRELGATMVPDSTRIGRMRT